MQVFVTGGTGAIGVHAIPALVHAGHTVSALAHTDAKAQTLRDQGATPVLASLFDRRALAAAFAGHHAVVNLASSLPSTTAFMRKSAWQECERVRSEGSATVVDAARTAGVQKIIQESVVMIYSDGATDWIDESYPVDHYPISRGNHAAEASARRFAEIGGGATILRFGVFYGPHATH
jgi:nucleoside-diphosphate-sugar epimerase